MGLAFFNARQFGGAFFGHRRGGRVCQSAQPGGFSEMPGQGELVSVDRQLKAGLRRYSWGPLKNQVA
jgi:hypothetical protein